VAVASAGPYTNLYITSLQTDNHASTPPLSFLQAGCPSCRPTNSVKALKTNWKTVTNANCKRGPWLPQLSMTHTHARARAHAHTHTFNGPLSRTTRASRYQKGKTNLDFTEARNSKWLGHMQVCTSLQTDNHASTPPLSFFTGWIPFLPPNQQCQSTEGTQLSMT